MREYKFRALKDDMSNCNWVYGYLIHDGGIPRITNDGGKTFHTCLKGTEGQFIGRKDRNEKEIYEGDITDYGVVSWFNDLNWDSGGSIHPGFYFGGDSKYDNELDYSQGFDDSIEVLGNIYEHPHLLNGK